MKSSFTAWIFIFFSLSVNANSIIDFHFIDNQTLVLHISEGRVDHYGLDQINEDNVLFKFPLSTDAAESISNYSISLLTCINDASNEIIQIGRKSKASDVFGVWDAPDYVSDHWIYLHFMCPLENNADFRLEFNGQFEQAYLDIYYHDQLSISSAIHVNNVGYSQKSEMKFAYVSSWMGSSGPYENDNLEGKDFHLFDMKTRELVYTGQIHLRKDLETGGPDIVYGEGDSPFGNFTGADVYECDFSDYNKIGNYQISVPGMGVSHPFFIAENVFQEPYYLTMRALYHHRSGIAIEEEFTEYPRPRDHHPAETDTVILSDWRYKDGVNAFDQLPANASNVKKPFYGGWHDAGDWDRNHNHLAGVHALLSSYEYNPGAFTDGELNIPESGNGIPDILDEARWCIDLFKRMQQDNGSVHGGLETTRHPESGVSSATDRDQWYAYAPDACATMHYASSAAHFAYLLSELAMDDMAQEYLQSARNAYDWAMDNPETNGFIFRDYRQLAAAYLFKASGDPKFQDQFKEDNLIVDENTPLYEYQNRDQQKALWCYATTDNPAVDLDYQATMKLACLNWAESDNIQTAQLRSGRMGYHWWAPTGWGIATTPQNQPLIAAYEISGMQRYLDYQFTTADYFLGANPLNMTWVTQLGEKHPEQVLHLDSWYYNNGNEMIPGIVPYGPRRYNPNANPNFWNPEYGMNSCYPNADDWPSHELWFENRYSPSTNEYTVWQTIAPSAAAYGSLRTKSDNMWPVVELEGWEISHINSEEPFMTLRCSAFDRDGEISTLEFWAYHLESGFIFTVPATGVNNEGLMIFSIPGHYHIYAQARDDNSALTVSKGVSFYTDFKISTDDIALQEFTLYPNPVSDELIVSLDSHNSNAIIEICDAASRQQASFTVSEKNNRIDVSELLTGIYFVRIRTQEGYLSPQKFIKF